MGASCITCRIHYFTSWQNAQCKWLDSMTRSTRSRGRGWTVVRKPYCECHCKSRTFFKFPKSLGHSAEKAHDFLSAVSLQVGPHGHEGDRMASTEISTDRERQEGGRTHQRGTINLSLPEWHFFEERTCSWSRDPNGIQGCWIPSVFSGTICNKILKRNEISHQQNPKTEWDFLTIGELKANMLEGSQ